ncbi:hypothetical protein WJX75_007901 [Coccomyxa subellipsoidea]|uniref:Uncharacterized protein n=1 Tax=Coccomyxa subellipsoidea TaxID=248742 RepID=A0ABR2YQC2_9CHLO
MDDLLGASAISLFCLIKECSEPRSDSELCYEPECESDSRSYYFAGHPQVPETAGCIEEGGQLLFIAYTFLHGIAP